MVFEHIIKNKWIAEKPFFAFLLGVVYSFIGVICSVLIFSSNPGYMAVAFTAVMLVPSLNFLLSQEENKIRSESTFSLRGLFKNHKDILIVYIFIFLGVLLAFSISTLLVPHESSQMMFKPQLLATDLMGKATETATNFDFELFWKILFNNIIILIISFILSLIYGAGAILFLTWNASAWGVAFGYIAVISASGTTPYSNFFSIMLTVLPHMLTEASAYLSGAFAGGVVSKAIIREKFKSKKFYNILKDGTVFLLLGLVLVIIAAIIEVIVIS